MMNLLRILANDAVFVWIMILVVFAGFRWWRLKDHPDWKD